MAVWTFLRNSRACVEKEETDVFESGIRYYVVYNVHNVMIHIIIVGIDTAAVMLHTK
jgi:hypothetical protein